MELACCSPPGCPGKSRAQSGKARFKHCEELLVLQTKRPRAKTLVFFFLNISSLDMRQRLSQSIWSNDTRQLNARTGCGELFSWLQLLLCHSATVVVMAVPCRQPRAAQLGTGLPGKPRSRLTQQPELALSLSRGVLPVPIVSAWLNRVEVTGTA